MSVNFFLNDEQKYYIKFMNKYLNYSANQIKDHPSLRRNDNTKYRLCTIKYWLNRIENTGDVKSTPKTGRKRLINKDKENHLVETIKANPKLRFRDIRLKSGLKNLSIRTVNQYSLRNNFRK